MACIMHTPTAVSDNDFFNPFAEDNEQVWLNALCESESLPNNKRRKISAARVVSPTNTSGANEVTDCLEEDEESPATASFLHQLCQHFPCNEAVIQTALLLDPSAPGQSAKLTSLDDSVIRGNYLQKKDPKKHQEYQYALNIVLANSTTGSKCHDVVQLLVDAAPHIVSAPEPHCNGVSSLHLALQRHSKDVKLLEILLQSSQGAAAASCCCLDRHGNTPLHTACQRDVGLEVVEVLLKAHPAALFHRNRRGETPLCIAQHTLTCPDAVVDYLQQKSHPW